METSVITADILAKGQGGDPINGVVLIKAYAIKLTKTGKEYIEGTIQAGKIYPFKAWGNSSAFSSLKNEDYNNTPTWLSGSFDSYLGNMSLVLDNVKAVEGYEPFQFFEQRYNKDSYIEGMKQILSSNVSEKGMAIINNILLENKPVMDRFSVEFAASGHHDNCLSGVLVHTYKVLSLLNYSLYMYPYLLTDDTGASSTDRKDLLFIGALLHDIGKIDEMNYGVYTDQSAITHRILGLEYIIPFKNDIISAYNPKWYRDLQSIIVEHHGEYGDPCRTIVAYIVHKVDMFDSVFTGLTQTMQEQVIQDNTGLRVKVDGSYLAI